MEIVGNHRWRQSLTDDRATDTSIHLRELFRLNDNCNSNRYTDSSNHHLRELLRLREEDGNRNRNTESSNHLREVLRLREEEEDNGNSSGNGNGNVRNVSSRTLGSVLNIENRSPSINQSNRTLLDIIKEDSSNKGNNKPTWKLLRDMLRLRRAGTVSDVVPIQASNIIDNRSTTGRDSTGISDSDPEITEHGLTESTQNVGGPMLQRNGFELAQSGLVESTQSLLEEDSNENEVAAEETMGEYAEGEGEEGPARMSLMALLAETDREMGVDGTTALYVMGVEEEEEESGVSNVGGGDSGNYNSCCVCMVRHKGAAFIPCGHTFCRLCSKELYAQRGNCPLCNTCITEILDIF